MTTATSSTRLPADTATEPTPGEPAKRSLVGRLFFPVVFGLLTIWGIIIMQGDPVAKQPFDPAAEFDLSDPIIFGDLGIFTINKGVIYLFIAVLGCIAVALYINRSLAKRIRQETKTQSLVEGFYEFAYDQIAGALPPGKLFNRYMPFVASIFVFVWLLNMISFVPLPLNSHHTIGDIEFFYSFGVYAVTSNFFCTLTLAMLTFLIYHFEGIRAHGFLGYIKTWSVGQTGPVLIIVYPVEILTNVILKPLSLAVRLFANMLSGHILILLMLALAGIIGGAVLTSALAQAAGVAVATAFYLFEMGLIASLQAFIFAVLSAIYIASAAEEHH